MTDRENSTCKIMTKTTYLELNRIITLLNHVCADIFRAQSLTGDCLR